MIKIAILGLGVVGGGVADILEKNSKVLSTKLGGSGEPLIGIKYVLDKRASVGHGLDDCITMDFEKILNDDEVSVVVETMGGIHPAYDFSKAALEHGKHVVTSNKAVVSACGDELVRIARENSVAYLFEASVGGGIPIIRPLMSCLAANDINRICGILNGTTNFILTEMETKDLSFEEALKKAQKLGYAEADPTADIGGADTARKICILANIAYNMFITHEDISYEGITGITHDDILLASMLGYRIKLIGYAAGEGDTADVFTAPMLVRVGTQLAITEGEFNCINVEGNAVGEITFTGKGAGSLPTASAIVADVLDAVTCAPRYPWSCTKRGSALTASSESYSNYYRTTDSAAAEKAASEHGVRTVAHNGAYAFILPAGVPVQNADLKLRILE
ncbi:MAG TPA: homoserine dehydrogenase [Bacillota bacterium]|nr:homoserine dehydrogenase [Bacillota bacterium]